MRDARLLLLLIPLFAACNRQPPPAEKARLPVLPAPPPAEVVATVEGRPITAAEVATQARASGKTPAQALEDLILAELLVRIADERGLAGDAEVQRRAREEMVRRYLKETFEKEVTPEKAVSSFDIRRAYNNALPRLVHPPLKEVHHVLVTTKKLDDRAAALAEEIRRRAEQVKGSEEFLNLQVEFQPRAKEIGCDIVAERVVTAREGWTEEAFAAASFALKRPGEVSPVTRTSFGYHVVRMASDIPAENVSLEEATPRIRADLFPRVREREFKRWLERQVVKHQVSMYPDRLNELQESEPAARKL